MPEKVAAGSVPKANAVLLWGGGQHLCPGKRFALSEMRGALKVVLSKLSMYIFDMLIFHYKLCFHYIIVRLDQVFFSPRLGQHWPK